MDRLKLPKGPGWSEAVDLDAAERSHPFSAANQNELSGNASTMLRDVVAAEVIPRLVMSMKASAGAVRPQAHEIDTLLQLSVYGDSVAAAASRLCVLKASGMQTPVLMDALLAPVARRLGELWTSDALDFVEVALAAGKLGTCIRRLDALSTLVAGPGAPFAMFVTLEAERHGLGAMSVAAAFRDAGWRTREIFGESSSMLASAAGADHFDLYGLSVSDPEHCNEASAIIAALRKASMNRRAVIAVGGAACFDDADFAARVGADFAAHGCAEAIAISRNVLPRRPRPGLFN